MRSVMVVRFATVEAVLLTRPIRVRRTRRLRLQQAMQPFVSTASLRFAGFVPAYREAELPPPQVQPGSAVPPPAATFSRPMHRCSGDSRTGGEPNVSFHFPAVGGVRALLRVDWREAFGQLLPARLVLAHQQAFKRRDGLVNRLLLIPKIIEDLP